MIGTILTWLLALALVGGSVFAYLMDHQRQQATGEVASKRGKFIATAIGLSLIVMLLTGCTTTRYVRVHCLTPEQLQQRKDAEPKRVGPELTGDAQKDVRIIGGSAKELRVWGIGNLGILGGCVG